MLLSSPCRLVEFLILGFCKSLTVVQFELVIVGALHSHYADFLKWSSNPCAVIRQPVIGKQLSIDVWNSGPLSFSEASPTHFVIRTLRYFTLSFSAEYPIHKSIFSPYSSQFCCLWKTNTFIFFLRLSINWLPKVSSVFYTKPNHSPSLSNFLLKRQSSLSFQVITKQDIVLFVFHRWSKSILCPIYAKFSFCPYSLLPVYILICGSN